MADVVTLAEEVAEALVVLDRLMVLVEKPLLVSLEVVPGPVFADEAEESDEIEDTVSLEVVEATKAVCAALAMPLVMVPVNVFVDMNETWPLVVVAEPRDRSKEPENARSSPSGVCAMRTKPLPYVMIALAGR